MLYRKMIKNAILSQYYEKCMSINAYFNKEVPLVVSVLLSMMFQMSGGILLILLAIIASELFDGYLFFLYFSLLALLQSFFQSKRDFKTFDSLYERSMFVYGCQNRKAIVSNAVAYAVLNMVNNPMVFVPYIVYPLFIKKKIAILFFQILVIFVIYISVFLGTSNRESGKADRVIYEDVMYVIKSIALVAFFSYLFRHFNSHKQNFYTEVLALNKELKVYGSIFLRQIITWMTAMVTSIGLLLSVTQYRISSMSRCIYYGEDKNRIWISKWVLRLAEICRDRKVKSDLLIIGRRRDLWKNNSNLAFLFPNTAVIVILFLINTIQSCKLEINVPQIIVTALIFEIAVTERFVFQNMSFMLFHHSELKNIELYKKCKKDMEWLFWKKLKLMCWLSTPAVFFSGILFMGVAAVWKEYVTMVTIIPLAIVMSVFLSFLHLYWMFCYKATYTEYEEFGTKKISLSVLNQLTSIPVGLLCLPFFLQIGNIIMGKELFSTHLICGFMGYVIVFSTVISIIVLWRSLKKYRI